MYFSFTHSTEVCQLPFELTDPEAGIDASALRAHAYSRLRVRLLRLVLWLVKCADHGWMGISGPQGRQLVNCCSALEGLDLPIHVYLGKLQMSSQVFHYTKEIGQTKGKGAGSAGDQSPACGQEVQDAPLPDVLEGMDLPEMFCNKR